jgi:hypothetical protein
MPDTKAGTLTAEMIDAAARAAAEGRGEKEAMAISESIAGSCAFHSLASSIMTMFPKINKATAESLVLTVFAIAIPIGQHLSVPVAVKVVERNAADGQLPSVKNRVDFTRPLQRVSDKAPARVSKLDRDRPGPYYYHVYVGDGGSEQCYHVGADGCTYGESVPVIENVPDAAIN